MNSGNSRVSSLARPVPPVVHAADGERVERGRHEVAAVVGEQARVAALTRMSATPRSDSAGPAPDSWRRSSTCRTRTRPSRRRAPAGWPSDVSLVSTTRSSRYAARTPTFRRSDRTDPRHAALELDAPRAIEGIRDDARRALLGLAEDERFVDLDELAARRPTVDLEPAAQIRYLAADHAPVPAIGLVVVIACAPMSFGLKLLP